MDSTCTSGPDFSLPCLRSWERCVWAPGPNKSSTVFLAIRKSRFPLLDFLRKDTDMKISLVCVQKANYSHCSVRFIVNKVVSWQLRACYTLLKRGKRNTDVIRQCLLVKVCQCACSSTSQGLPVGGAGLFFFCRPESDKEGPWRQLLIFRILFSSCSPYLWARWSNNIMKKILDFTVACFPKISLFIYLWGNKCVLQNLLAFVWRNMYESMDFCYLTSQTLFFLSLHLS